MEAKVRDIWGTDGGNAIICVHGTDAALAMAMLSVIVGEELPADVVMERGRFDWTEDVPSPAWLALWAR